MTERIIRVPALSARLAGVVRIATAAFGVVRSSLGPLARVPQAEPRRWWEVIAWWELRRIPYNVIAGIVAIAGIALFTYVDTLPPQLPPEERDFDYFIAIYGGWFLANFFYTGGWVCEIFLRSVTKREARWFGPTMLTAGLLFSLAVPTLNVAGETLLWLSRVVTR
jgi:hypothetical protein